MDLKIDTEILKTIIELAEVNHVEELDLQYKDFKIYLKRNEGYNPTYSSSRQEINIQKPAKNTEKKQEPKAQPKEDIKGLIPVVSPLSGIFYRAPGPDAPPFVEVGDKVSPGQTLCIVEAMKMMNEITSEIEGVITAVKAENSQPVEAQQLLFYVKPSASK